jgi:hypothetical protein
MYANGYNLCTLDINNRRGRVYLRRFDGDRSWLPDFRTSRPNADGSFDFEVPVKREEDAPQIAKATIRRKFVRTASIPITRHDSSVPNLVTSSRPDSVPTLPSDILRQEVGGISINVYVQAFGSGSGLRRLVNNRYIIAHAVQTTPPYSNVVAVARGPRRFSETEIREPVWKLWLKNDVDESKLLMVADSEQIQEGWHNFLLRWDHSKPVIELILDGHVLLADAAYLEAWPTRFMADISFGAWPRRSPEHYAETCIAGWSFLGDAFDDATIRLNVASTARLPPCQTGKPPVNSAQV